MIDEDKLVQSVVHGLGNVIGFITMVKLQLNYYNVITGYYITRHFVFTMIYKVKK